MTLFEYIRMHKPPIVEYIKNFLEEKAKTVPKEYIHLYETLRDFSVEGKFLRGCFLLMSYEMAGGKNVRSMIPAAAAVEINQSAFLIHDDIMDRDLLRRGVPSVFAHYIEEGKRMKTFDAEHYGIGAGILIGDLAIFLGYELLDKAQIPSQRKRSVSLQYAEDLQHTVTGQMIDFNFSNTAYEPSEEEILEMYRLKTARYSLVNPFLMGAYAAGADKKYVTALSELCEKLGLIFQIKDDEIGLLGDEKITGKMASSDVRENKKTLIWKYLFDAANDEERAWLNSLFGNEAISQGDFEKLVQHIKMSGVQKKINTKLCAMADMVSDDIDKLPIENSFAQMLKDLTHYSLTRNK